jgi:citrate lyase subunit beta/citryl-CoA lyase
MNVVGPALLFCPGDRPDRFAKAAERADRVILDLEDAVAPTAKEGARNAVVEALPGLDPTRTVVRVNPLDGPWGADDVNAVLAAGASTLMLPKSESPEAVARLGEVGVIALCETAAGVLNAATIVRADNCVGLMWGGEDLMASTGGRSSRQPDGSYNDVVLRARSEALLAAAAAGVEAIDAVWLAIEDLDGLAAEAADAATLGFDSKACIHPSHADVIRAAFEPDAGEVAWAEQVLAIAAERGGGVFTHEGKMIDGPLLGHAEAILGRSGRGR